MIKIIKKYNRWYQALKPAHQLIVSFILNWLYWFLAFRIGEKLIFNEVSLWSENVFSATWQAFFMTLILNWKKVTTFYRLFRKKEIKSGG